MQLGEVQNQYGKTLDTQYLVQQAVSQSDTATRQTSAILAAERARRQSQVEQGAEAAEGQDASLKSGPRPDSEKLRRYRLVLKNGVGESVEIEANLPEPKRSRLDINA